MTPERLRAYVLIFTRDMLPPILGAYLVLVRGWPSELWHPPALLGLLGVTALAPRGKGLPPGEDEDDGG